MRKEKVIEFLRYTFSPVEILAMHDELSQAIDRGLTAENEKKSAMAGFKDRIEKEAAFVGITNRKIRSGFEMRNTDCKVLYNSPNTGFKTIVRLDTGEVVKEDAMTKDEMQETLFTDSEAVGKADEAVDEADRTLKAFAEQPEAEKGDVTGWLSGAYLVAATSVEEAQAYAAREKLPVVEPFRYVDQDTTLYGYDPDTYGDESRSVRKGIAVLKGKAATFPLLLDFPDGSDDDKGETEAEGDGKPKGKNAARDARRAAKRKLVN